ncbi:MAG: maleylpyruvate isomerase N-terminal domain-containing protein [Acidimicrobiales bacterium]
MQLPTRNTSDESDWAWLQGEIRSASRSFVDQLRLIDAGSQAVPNLDWDVRELAAHVVCLPAFYKSLNESAEPMEMPAHFPDFSRSVRAHLDQHDLEALAGMLLVETESLLENLGDEGTAPWMLYLNTTVEKVGAGYLGELLLHGQDLAPLSGATVAIEARHAHRWIAASMTLAPFFVDREVARKYPGVYHLRFRGGEEYTMRIVDGVLSINPGRPPKPDGHMVADPVAYMLVSMGRMSQVRAGLTGKIVVYGRRPWKFFGLDKIRVDGV